MPVVWTGAAGKFLSSQDPSSPAVNSLIHNARKVAGGIVNSIQLGDTWYGSRRVPIAPGVEIAATVISNFPDLEPLVRLQILVEGKPPEEDEKEERKCIPAFVASWPYWLWEEQYSQAPILIAPNDFPPEFQKDEVGFDTYVYNFSGDPENEPADNSEITLAKASYKSRYRNGPLHGEVDWQGRGEKYILTWKVGKDFQLSMAGFNGDAIAAYRGSATSGGAEVYHCGRVKEQLSPSYGVIGAAVETRDDENFLNIIARSRNDDNSAWVITFFTRPWGGGPGQPLEVVSETELPFGLDTAQFFFFNDSGNTAAGIVRRFAAASYTSGDLGDQFKFWRIPYEGATNMVATVAMGEVILGSSGTVTTDYMKVDDYAVMPDTTLVDTFYLERHPLLGNEEFSSFPSVTKVTIAIDWKGDVLTRCTATVVEEASVTNFEWLETIQSDGPMPATDTGAFSMTCADVLIEFENSELPSFYAFEITNSTGNYTMQYDADGNLTLGESSHASTNILKMIPFIDLRYDFLALVEAVTNTTLDNVRSIPGSSTGTVTPTRTVDLTWTLQKGPTILETATEPRWTQTVWRGRDPATIDPIHRDARLYDEPYKPDMWSASLAMFGCIPAYLATGMFEDTLGVADAGNIVAYQGYMRQFVHNTWALIPFGVPFIDRKVNLATFGGEVTAFMLNTAWRVDNSIDQTSTTASPTGQTLSVTGMITPASIGSGTQTVPLNTYLGIPDGNLGFRYYWSGSIWILDEIFTITLM